MRPQTDKEIILQGGKSFMMIIDTNPFKTQHQRRLWDIGYKKAKREWELKNPRKKVFAYVN